MSSDGAPQMAWEPFFRSLAETIQDWESWHDPSGRLRWVNHGVERISGFSSAECLAMADFPRQLLAPESQEHWEEARREPEDASDGAGRCRVEIVRKDGTRRWVDLSWLPVRDPGGTCLGYRTHAYDVHERTEAEERWALREAELAAQVHAADARYRLVTAHVTDVIYSCDLAGRILWASPSVERMHGYAPLELAGEPLSRLLTPGARALADAVFAEGRRLVDEGKPVPEFRFELEQVRRDGTLLWVEVSGGVVRGTDGRATGFVVMARDIDARRRMEEALRASEERYRLLADHVSDVIWTGDLSGRLTYVSPSVERLLGYDVDSLVGRRALDTMTPDSGAILRECVQGALARAAAGERDVMFLVEVEHLRLGGGSVWTEVHGSVVYGEDGAPTAVLGISRDITERRRAQALAMQASRMQATATLAGGIAHDFNNLMVRVIGYAELLKLDLAANVDQVAMLDEILSAAKGAGDLSQQMLAYARGGRYQTKDLQMNDLADRALQGQRPRTAASIRVVRDFDPGLWKVNADGRQMEQMLANLLANAWEAIDGAGTVTVATRNVEVRDRRVSSDLQVAPGRWVELTVSDTGCGMTPEVRARVFEPFFSTKFTGRGLGLPAVYGIVENHGGRVAVTATEPGKGTTVTVLLPAV